MKKITIITADIVNSRKHYGIVNSIVDKLIGIQHPNLITPFSMSRGDEIQGVTGGWLTNPEIIRRLRYLCRPLGLRIGIGLGLITS